MINNIINGSFSLALHGNCELKDNFKRLRSEMLISGIDSDAHRLFTSDNLCIEWVYDSNLKLLTLTSCLLSNYGNLRYVQRIFMLIAKQYEMSNLHIFAEFVYKDLEERSILNVIRTAISHEDMFRVLTKSNDNSVVLGQSIELIDFVKKHAHNLTFNKLRPYLPTDDFCNENYFYLFDLSRCDYTFSFYKVYLGSNLEDVSSLVCFYSQLIITAVTSQKSHSHIKNLPDFEYFRVHLANLKMSGPLYFDIRQHLYKLFREGWAVREVKENEKE